MFRSKIWAVLTLTALTIGAAVCVETVRDSGTGFAAEAVKPYIESGECPGAISVFYKNGVQETACLGYADAARKIPMSLDRTFMQCSQTKGFCGVTVAMLVEEGKI
ncbi:MAG: serine hydrolase, partial [Lentisphaeria bacterium]|nr:serine hydrolase [Lentisphaeria bacterium]